MNVLIVEDDKDINEMVTMLLSEEGHLCVSCFDGLEALNWLQNNPCPDVMLSDLKMPNMTGIELVKAIREDENLKALPIIICSGSSEHDKDARLATCTFVHKPCPLGDLIALVAVKGNPN